MAKTISLAKINLILVVISLMVCMLFLYLFLSFGLDRVQENWHVRELESLNQYVSKALLSLHEENNTVTQSMVSQAMEDLPYSPIYLIIRSSDDEILYSYHRSDRGQGRSRIMNPNQEWKDVVADKQVLFRFSTYIPAFTEIDANALLLSSAKQVLVYALLTANLVAVVLALVVLLPLRRTSERLASNLRKIAEGNRTITFEHQTITEFETIAQASLVLQQNLVQEEKLRGQWTMDIAHDLRTPVTVLKGQLEAISDGLFVPDEKRLQLLIKETERLEHLIQGLSLLTRLQSPGFVVQAEELSLATCLSDLHRRFEAKAMAQGKKIVVSPTQARIEADKQLFSRLLDNLLSNAIAYSLPSSEIVLTVEENAQGIAQTLSITNEGIIPPDFLEHVFDRLSRSEQSRGSEGSGLGLAIVKAISEVQGWTVTVESKEKTCFTVHFT